MLNKLKSDLVKIQKNKTRDSQMIAAEVKFLHSACQAPADVKQLHATVRAKSPEIESTGATTSDSQEAQDTTCDCSTEELATLKMALKEKVESKFIVHSNFSLCTKH
ncbi:hypothetical protein BaRGS_00028496 [Batillaria attramentaria]|uniref:Uncharacterized protein n=1 Tax=Batillaria attramentaria TaxID=370345 RepID=A0ABD0K052_9CAEN